VYDYGETPDGIPYLVMELVEGQTLKDLLARKRLTLASGLQIIGKVAEALAEAHQKNVIHRDIKPSNIIVNERGEVKVVDFGIAKSVKAESPAAGANADGLGSTVTSRDVIVGTPGYLSPEQAVASRVDARSDIFSLGALLYECIAGRPAFQGKDADDIRSKMLYDDPPPPSEFNREVPPDLDRLTLKALAKKADDRFQTADEFLKALTRVHLPPADDSLDREKPPAGTEPNKPPAETNPEPSKNDSQLTDWRSSVVSAMRRPRHLAAAFLITLAAGLLFWGAWRLWPAKVYEPRPEVRDWYVRGTNALRDGTYDQARRMLEQAVSLDQRYALAHARLAEALSELGYADRSAGEMSRANVLVINDGLKLAETDALYLKAINAVTSRDFGTAIFIYEQLLNQSPDGEKAYLHVDLGRAFEKNEETERALRNYEEAIRINSQCAAAFLRAGVLYGRRQDFPKAWPALDEAYRLYEAQTNMEGMAEVLYQRGVLFSSKGEVGEARKVFEQALHTTSLINNTYQQVRTLLQLSRVLSTASEPERAQRLASQAIDLARANNIHDLAAQGLFDLGNSYFARGQAEQAEEYFRQALGLMRAQNLRAGEARAMLTLGSLYVQQDDADTGLRYVAQALPFYEQGGYRTQTLQTLALTGQGHRLKGEYGEAARAFEKQLRLAGEWNNPMQVALAHDGIGTVLLHQDRYTEALGHFDESYSIYNNFKVDLYAGYSLTARADALWRLGRYEEARAAVSQAASSAESKFKQLWGRVYAVSAPMALSEMRPSDAVRDGMRAIAADDSRAKHAATAARTTVGLAQALSGLKGQGLKTCQEAVSMAEGASDPRLLSNALLALAEASLLSGDATQALAASGRAQQMAQSADQTEAEWRAWLLVGLASQRLGDAPAAREALARANALLSSLRQKWGASDFGSYLNRPDVKLRREQLMNASASVPSPA
jgi:tetratricopeptide (TPR) repeat protein